MADVPYEAGAGRGKQGGPTAEQLLDYEEKDVWSSRKAERGDYGSQGKTAAPSDVMPPVKPKTKKYAKGGSVSASKRADGCAQRGKTRGRYL